MTVIAAVSHKGGTGRSVTTANIAYHLAQAGKDVCIVDLDLASPTFGGILGFQGIEAGVPKPGAKNSPKSIGDFLADPTEVSYLQSALMDVWQTETLRSQTATASYMLLPGSRHIGDSYSAPEMRDAMDRLIDELRDRFAVVYLDLRSGASELLASFRSADGTNEPRACDLWLLHFRWTKQHLIGLDDVIAMLNQDETARVNPDRQFLVKTAYVSPDSVQPAARQAVVRQQHRELSSILDSIRIGSLPASDKLIGEIPLEPMLQWREGIITRNDTERGLANEESYNAFASLTELLLERMDEPS